MKLTTTVQVSVEGVMQGPGGPEEDERGRFERADGRDEVNLFIFPVAVGLGTRPFPDTGRDSSLELVGSRATPNGITIQVYRPTDP